MPEVFVAAETGLALEEAFARISDFRRLAELSSAVRRVEVFEEDGRAASRWEVNFRRGVLIWSEWDEVDPGSASIEFHRRDGDPLSFDGGWLVSPSERGSLVSFRVEFDLGMPTLADVVDPIAARTLRDNVVDVFEGALGAVAFTDARATARAGGANGD